MIVNLLNTLNTCPIAMDNFFFKYSYFAEMHNGKARQIHGHSQHLTKGLIKLLI